MQIEHSFIAATGALSRRFAQASPGHAARRNCDRKLPGDSQPMRKAQHKLVAEAIRELLCGRVTTARTVLDKPRIPDDETVHTARKELKGARAGLRLLRGVAGEDRYVYENARLRDAARPLSHV